MRLQNIKQLAYILLPTVLFYIFYSYLGLKPAMLISGLFSISVIIYSYVKSKKIANTQLFGVLGLLFSFIAILFTDNEKLYYVPSIINNSILTCIAVVLTMNKKSIFHYIVKDFDIPLIKNTSENNFLILNYLWIAFFIIKIVSKIIGILLLDFKQLYWLVFILGDPMTIALAAYSVAFINKKISST